MIELSKDGALHLGELIARASTDYPEAAMLGMVIIAIFLIAELAYLVRSIF